MTEERQREERREERRQDEERRREERRQDEERRRQDAEAAERRHQEMMVALIAALNRGNGQANGERQDNDRSELIRSLQQTIEDLQAENERLRQQNGNGDSSPRDG